MQFPEIVEVKYRKYKLEKKIGEGSSGFIFRAQNIVTQEFVAVKLQDSLSVNEEKQLNALEDLHLKHNVNILGFRKQYKWNNGFINVIIMELGDDSFQNIIEKGVVFIPIQTKLNYFQQIVTGVMELHLLGIIHRDIKPQNIIYQKINTTKNDEYLLKLCDTGLMRDKDGKKTQKQGTSLYMAPEQIQSSDYNEKVDIWALGMILFQLLNSGQTLFQGEYDWEIQSQILNITQDAINQEINGLNCDQDLKDILLKLIVKEQQKRLSIRDLILELKITFEIEQQKYQIYQEIILENDSQIYKAQNLMTKQWVALKILKANRYSMLYNKSKQVIIMELYEGPILYLIEQIVQKLSIVERYKLFFNYFFSNRCYPGQTSIQFFFNISYDNQYVFKLNELSEKDNLNNRQMNYFMAPEQTNREKYDNNWCFGMLLYLLIEGKPPFEQVCSDWAILPKQNEINEKIDKLKCQPMLKRILKSTINLQPQLRLSIWPLREILQIFYEFNKIQHFQEKLQICEEKINKVKINQNEQNLLIFRKKILNIFDKVFELQIMIYQYRINCRQDDISQYWFYFIIYYLEICLNKFELQRNKSFKKIKIELHYWKNLIYRTRDWLQLPIPRPYRYW